MGSRRTASTPCIARDGAVWAGTLSAGAAGSRMACSRTFGTAARSGVEHRGLDPRERRRHRVVRDAERHQHAVAWRLAHLCDSRRPAVERRQRSVRGFRRRPSGSGTAGGLAFFRSAAFRTSLPTCRRRCAGRFSAFAEDKTGCVLDRDADRRRPCCAARADCSAFGRDATCASTASPTV